MRVLAGIALAFALLVAPAGAGAAADRGLFYIDVDGIRYDDQSDPTSVRAMCEALGYGDQSSDAQDISVLPGPGVISGIGATPGSRSGAGGYVYVSIARGLQHFVEIRACRDKGPRS